MNIEVNCATGQVTQHPDTPKPLPAAQADKWGQAKTLRDAHIEAGCNVPGIGRFDTDETARMNVTGAVTGAMIAAQQGKPFSVPWKLADNTLVTLDGSQMIAVGLAVLNWVSSCHAHSQQIGAAIMAAQDHAALDAIDLTAGWPA